MGYYRGVATICCQYSLMNYPESDDWTGKFWDHQRLLLLHNSYTSNFKISQCVCFIQTWDYGKKLKEKWTTFLDRFGNQKYANSSTFRLIVSQIGLVPWQFTNNLNPDLICKLQRNLINAAIAHSPRIFEKCCLFMSSCLLQPSRSFSAE